MRKTSFYHLRGWLIAACLTGLLVPVSAVYAQGVYPYPYVTAGAGQPARRQPLPNPFPYRPGGGTATRPAAPAPQPQPVQPRQPRQPATTAPRTTQPTIRLEGEAPGSGQGGTRILIRPEVSYQESAPTQVIIRPRRPRPPVRRPAPPPTPTPGHVPMDPDDVDYNAHYGSTYTEQEVEEMDFYIYYQD